MDILKCFMLIALIVLETFADEEGCLSSAGYSYCVSKDKCYRPFEEDCPECDNGQRWCYDDGGKCYYPIGGYCENKDGSSSESEEPLVGGDEDEYGCIPSAGYSYCESKDKCYRPFEEDCPQCGYGQKWCYDGEGSCYQPIGGYCEDKDGSSSPSGYPADAVESETDELVLCANMRCDTPFCFDGDDGGICCSVNEECAAEDFEEDNCIQCGDKQYDNECYAICDGLSDDDLDDCTQCDDTFYDKISDFGDQISDKADEIGDQISEKVGDLKDKLTDYGQDIQDAIPVRCENMRCDTPICLDRLDGGICCSVDEGCSAEDYEEDACVQCGDSIYSNQCYASCDGVEDLEECSPCETLSDKISDKAEEIGDTISDKADELKDTVTNWGQDVQDKVKGWYQDAQGNWQREEDETQDDETSEYSSGKSDKGKTDESDDEYGSTYSTDSTGDSNGCLKSAGYSYCETLGRCYRPFEEICPPADSPECPAGSTGMMWCETKQKCLRFSTGATCPYCPKEQKWCYDNGGSCFYPVGGYCEDREGPADGSSAQEVIENEDGSVGYDDSPETPEEDYGDDSSETPSLGLTDEQRETLQQKADLLEQELRDIEGQINEYKGDVGYAAAKPPKSEQTKGQPETYGIEPPENPETTDSSDSADFSSTLYVTGISSTDSSDSEDFSSTLDLSSTLELSSTDSSDSEDFSSTLDLSSTMDVSSTLNPEDVPPAAGWDENGNYIPDVVEDWGQDIKDWFDGDSDDADNDINPICNLPSETGPCRAAFTNYYFNSNTKQCETFTYGGCEGNENNFENLEDCQSFAEENCDVGDNDDNGYGSPAKQEKENKDKSDGEDLSETVITAIATFKSSDSGVEGTVKVDENGNVFINLDVSQLDASPCKFEENDMVSFKYSIRMKFDNDLSSKNGPDQCGTDIVGEVYNPFGADLCNERLYSEGDTYFTCALGDLSGRFGTLYPSNDNRLEIEGNISENDGDKEDGFCVSRLTPESVFGKSVVFNCLDKDETYLFCAPFEINVEKL